jgi:hypothetical protein
LTWGEKIQVLFGDLHVMLAEYPELAIALVVHLKKPNAALGSLDTQNDPNG